MNPERELKIRQAIKNRQGSIAVVLDNVHDPHNIFAVLRTCDAVGVQNVYVINPRFSKDLQKQSKQSSSGALKWVSMHQFESTTECMQLVQQQYSQIWATHLSAEAKTLYDVDFTGSVALVFGNEHKGVSEQCLSHCTGNFIIPQVGMVQSLNISVACAVSLYEAFRQRKNAGYYQGNTDMPEMEQQALARRWKIYDELSGK